MSISQIRKLRHRMVKSPRIAQLLSVMPLIFKPRNSDSIISVVKHTKPPH